jgi:hypothetical protein
MKRALFLHTQKTAGTSVQLMARWAYGNDNVCSHGDYVTLGVEGCARLPFVSGHFGIEFAKPLMPSRYCFTFLRDPIERLISLYAFCAVQTDDNVPLYYAARRNSLENFLRLGFSDDEHLRSALWNHQVWQLSHGRGADLVGKQRRIIDFEPDNLLQAAIHNLSLFNYVGLVETFDRDIREIFTALGRPDEIVRRTNVTRHRIHYTDLPSSTQKLLHDLTELDFIFYGYVRAQRAKSTLLLT